MIDLSGHRIETGGSAIRILIVTNFFPPFVLGGAEIVAHRLALQMKNRGHEVAVFAGRLPEAGRMPGDFDRETVDGMAVHRLVIRSLEPGDAFHWEAAARRLDAIITDFAPDVAHFHNVIGLGANLIPAAKRRGVKTLVTLHDHWGFCFKNTRLRNDQSYCRDFEECTLCLTHIRAETGIDLPIRARRDYVAWCLDQADALVSPSQYLAASYEEAGIGAGRLCVRGNGIDIGRFGDGAGDSRSKMRFVCIGYLGEHKGLRVLMQTVKVLLGRSELTGRWELDIVGAGHLEAWLKSEITKLGKAAPVKFLGKLPQSAIPGLLGQSGVLVLPSIWPENQPVVLLEAIAAGRAQIATATGGNAELVEDGAGGLLCPPGDAMALAGCMVRYIAEPGLARAHGEFNLARRGGFSESAAADGYDAQFKDLLTRESAETDVPVILCGGGWPQLSIAKFFENYAKVSENVPRARFVHVKYASASVWDQAAALWLWEDYEMEGAVLRALRARIPIIAPRSQGVAMGLETASFCAVSYADNYELAAVFAALLKNKPARGEWMGGAGHAAGMLAQAARPEAFLIYAGDPAR